ncbi:MAG: DUF4199 domain-containing protein [Bacteroidales bacterium]|nr:DUF4199 domain-containing protein [Bacteroidales bacterium]
MKEVVDNKTLWNEAARVGIVFGLFSSVCLGLKEAAALTNSTLLVTAAAIILWAVEFFGCILLMKKYMLDELEKYEGMTQLQLYKFGRRVALLSGFILAVVNAVLVSLIPDETLAETLNETMAAMPASMQADAEDTMALMMDRFPLLTFLGQWFYCFLYGSILSAIMSRYVSVYSVFKRSSGIDPHNNDDTPDDQSADDEPEEQ